MIIGSPPGKPYSSNWCTRGDVLGVDEADLSGSDRLEFEFCLGGIMTLLAYRADTKTDLSISDFLAPNFGKTLLAHMAKLRKQP